MGTGTEPLCELLDCYLEDANAAGLSRVPVYSQDELANRLRGFADRLPRVVTLWLPDESHLGVAIGGAICRD